MRILAIDTALTACAVAVLDTQSDRLLASESKPMLRGHAEMLMPFLDRVMKQAKLKLRDIERIAVTTGPGSFTGLRVGIAAARGLALAADIPAVGVSTLAAFAAPPLAADDTVPVVAAIDARHGQVYLQVFGPGARSQSPPRIAPLSEAVRAAAEAPCCLVGSAARTVAAAITEAGHRPGAMEIRESPDIAWVARLGAAAAEGQSPPTPQYLRAPDAQPQHAASIPRR